MSPAVDTLAASIPEAATDLRLNLQVVLRESTLSPAQKWGIAVAAAIAARHAPLRDAVVADARAAVEPGVVEDAAAAAAIMGMNNVYYRFRHMVAKPEYGTLPARLRMNRLARPATSKIDFELMALAVSAINGCESCIRAHEKTVTEAGITPEQVNDAVRIAAVMQGAAVALEAAAVAPAGAEPAVARPAP